MATTKKSTDLVVIEGTIQSADVVKAIQEPGTMEFRIEEDPEEVSKRIDRQLIESSGPEALFGGTDDVLHGKDYVGKAFELTDVEWRPSDKDNTDSLPFFGVFHIVTKEGEKRVLTCGA